MADIEFENTAFFAAADYLRQKEKLPTKTWTDLMGDMHSRAFVIAGAMKDEMLADFQSALLKAVEDGTTLSDFRKDFDKIVKKHGWSYKGERGWRTKVIYNTNIQQAYQAGHWKAIQEGKKERPYLVYKTQDDGRVRDQHAAWHDKVLPADDPWWDTHYPMNGWNCRCYVRNITKEEMEEEKLQVWQNPDNQTETKTVRTGGTTTEVTVPKGVAPGFDGNSGKAWLGGELTPDEMAMRKAKGYKEITGFRVADEDNKILLKPRKTKAKMVLAAKNRSDAERIFQKSIGDKKEAILKDPKGGALLISNKIVDHAYSSAKREMAHRERYFPFLKELIEDPDDIRVRFLQDINTRKVVLRKTYRRVIKGSNGKVLILVADEDNGWFSGFNYFQGDNKEISEDKDGISIYRKK